MIINEKGIFLSHAEYDELLEAIRYIKNQLQKNPSYRGNGESDIDELQAATVRILNNYDWRNR